MEKTKSVLPYKVEKGVWIICGKDLQSTVFSVRNFVQRLLKLGFKGMPKAIKVDSVVVHRAILQELGLRRKTATVETLIGRVEFIDTPVGMPTGKSVEESKRDPINEVTKEKELVNG